MITALTTCMGRLNHLEMTLPLMLEEFERVIVVDYSCPQNSGDWAEKEGAIVVRGYGAKYWNASRARNLGAKNIDSQFACFLDADTIVMPGTRKKIESLLKPKTMVVASRRESTNQDIPSLNGFIAVAMTDFWSVGGYTETMEGYAIEDGFLRAQLCLESGVGTARLPPEFLMSIMHGDDLRSQHQKEPVTLTAARNMNLLFDYLRSQGVTDWQNDPRTREMAYR